MRGSVQRVRKDVVNGAVKNVVKNVVNGEGQLWQR